MKKNYSIFQYVAIIVLLLGFNGVVNANNSAVDVTNQAWDWSWDGSGQRVANPLKNSTNNSDQVWEFTPTTQWAGFSYGNEAGLGIDFSKYSKFECLVYCPSATQSIKIFIEAEGAGSGVDLGFVECSGNWAIASGSVSSWNGSAANKFAIKNGDNTQGGMKIYFDKIRFVDPSSVSEIVIDNGETVTQAWDWSWGGLQNAFSVVNNPRKDAVNGTDKVTKLTPSADWGGLSFGYSGSTVANENNFAVFSEFQMLVYSDNVTTPFKIIVGIDDNSAFFEVENNFSTGWVKVTQNVSSWAGNSSDKFFIKTGDGTAGKNVYIDEIKFVKPGSSSFVHKPILDDYKVYFDGNNITLNSAVDFDYVLYNVVGSFVSQGQSKHATAVIPINNMAKGVYIVKMNVDGVSVNTKITVY